MSLALLLVKLTVCISVGHEGDLSLGQTILNFDNQHVNYKDLKQKANFKKRELVF
jgi:hypothetical protein